MCILVTKAAKSLGQRALWVQVVVAPSHMNFICTACPLAQVIPNYNAVGVGDWLAEILVVSSANAFFYACTQA